MQNEVRMQKSDCRMQNGGLAVQAKGLVRVYRRGAEEIRALDGIDLTIGQGEFLGVVGHSGAGKTTLLNLMGLMDRPTAGRLVVLGNDVSPRARLGHDPKSPADLGHVPRGPCGPKSGQGDTIRIEDNSVMSPDFVPTGLGHVPRQSLDSLRRKNIGFVFQEFYLMPALSALENVLLPTMWGGGGSKDRARKLLEQVGLGKRMTHRPAELSGGEMQRVAVARALINSPRLILADEPTGNLDTKTRDDTFDLLLALNRDSGLTVAVATHDTSLESRFTRVIRLEDGKVVSNG